jgi:hypothetical protein
MSDPIREHMVALGDMALLKRGPMAPDGDPAGLLEWTLDTLELLDGEREWLRTAEARLWPPERESQRIAYRAVVVALQRVLGDFIAALGVEHIDPSAAKAVEPPSLVALVQMWILIIQQWRQAPAAPERPN